MFGIDRNKCRSSEGGSPNGPFDLTVLPDGESAKVVSVSGGPEAVGRLESMGILPGAVIQKRSSALRRGPIVVGRGGTQLAIAFATARGILVEPVR